MKKLFCLLLSLALIFSLAACGTKKEDTQTTTDDSQTTQETTETTNEPVEGIDINIGVLAGPTGIGAVGLMEANDNGETVNNYTFTVASANDEIVEKLTSGDLDIAALATNVASALYNKTSGGIQICALNTYGVLYVLENGTSIESIADLKGQTVCMVGQGANPEYTFEYLLTQNGLTYSTDGSDADVQIEFYNATELVPEVVSGSVKIAVLPEPSVTACQLQAKSGGNEDLRVALDFNKEWENCGAEGVLTMGCIVVRTEFAKEHPAQVAAFLEEYSASITSVQADASHAGELCEQYGIVAKAAAATKAIPNCALCCVTGSDIQTAIEPYYNVLFNANPKSIGGAIPDEAFYFVA